MGAVIYTHPLRRSIQGTRFQEMFFVFDNFFQNYSNTYHIGVSLQISSCFRFFYYIWVQIGFFKKIKKYQHYNLDRDFVFHRYMHYRKDLKSSFWEVVGMKYMFLLFDLIRVCLVPVSTLIITLLIVMLQPRALFRYWVFDCFFFWFHPICHNHLS